VDAGPRRGWARRGWPRKGGGKLTATGAPVGDGDGSPGTAGRRPEVTGALVGVAVDAADRPQRQPLLSAEAATARALDAVGAQVLVQEAAAPVPAAHPRARTWTRAERRRPRL
jgi:hypothetical protein